MKSFLKYLKSAVVLTVLMLVVCGLAYPAALTGIGQAVFPHQANGSLVTAEGEKTTDSDKAVGSAIVGQDFSGDARYFQGRVSGVNYYRVRVFSSDSSCLLSAIIDWVNISFAWFSSLWTCPISVSLPRTVRINDMPVLYMSIFK